MTCEVEFIDEFGEWWNSLDEDEQGSVDAYVRMLEQYGAALPHPYSSGVIQSRHSHMRELRPQHKGRPYRVLYAFDPSRRAVLLLGGDKTGDDRWYDRNVPKADDRYDQHIKTLKKEGAI